MTTLFNYIICGDDFCHGWHAWISNGISDLIDLKKIDRIHGKHVDEFVREQPFYVLVNSVDLQMLYCIRRIHTVLHLYVHFCGIADVIAMEISCHTDHMRIVLKSNDVPECLHLDLLV